MYGLSEIYTSKGIEKALNLLLIVINGTLGIEKAVTGIEPATYSLQVNCSTVGATRPLNRH